MITSVNRLARTLALISGGIGLVVTLGLPLAYLAIVLKGQDIELQVEADLNAAEMNELIAQDPEAWSMQILRLETLLAEDKTFETLPERRAMVGFRTRTTGPDGAWPGTSDAPVDQIPHAVAQLDAAVFEFGQRAVLGFGRTTVGAGFGRGVGQQRLGVEHRVHLFGIGLPVGGEVQVATGLDVARQPVHKRALDQAALVVPALVPGIGEEDMDPVQALLAQHVVQDFHRVVAEDADVFDTAFADELEQGAHARFVHFAANEVVLGPDLGEEEITGLSMLQGSTAMDLACVVMRRIR